MATTKDVSPDWAGDGRLWVLVRVAKDGADSNSGVNIITETSAIFQAANNAADITNAIDDAREWADANGVAIVHVKRYVAPIR